MVERRLKRPVSIYSRDKIRGVRNGYFYCTLLVEGSNPFTHPLFNIENVWYVKLLKK